MPDPFAKSTMVASPYSLSQCTSCTKNCLKRSAPCRLDKSLISKSRGRWRLDDVRRVVSATDARLYLHALAIFVYEPRNSVSVVCQCASLWKTRFRMDGTDQMEDGLEQ